jgi:hypothetical protein
MQQLSWTGTARSWVVLLRLSLSMVAQIPVTKYTSLSQSLYISFLPSVLFLVAQFEKHPQKLLERDVI